MEGHAHFQYHASSMIAWLIIYGSWAVITYSTYRFYWLAMGTHVNTRPFSFLPCSLEMRLGSYVELFTNRTTLESVFSW